MSSVVAELVATLGFEVNMGQFKKAESGLQNLIGLAKGLVGAFVASKAVAAFQDTINAMDALGDRAEQLGITAEALSALQYAAQLSGSSSEQLTDALGMMQQRLAAVAAGGEEAVKEFAKFGIEVKDSNGELSTVDKVLLRVADRVAKADNQIKKAAIATAAFGKQGRALIPFLSKGAAGINELRKEAEKFGGVITADQTKAAGDFNDQLDRLKTRFGALVKNVVAPLLKPLGKIVDYLLEATLRMPDFLKVLKQIAIPVGLTALIIGLNALPAAIFAVSALIGSTLVPALTTFAVTAGTVALPLAAIVLILDEIFTTLQGGDSLIWRLVEWADSGSASMGSFKRVMQDALAVVFDLTNPERWKNLGTSIVSFLKGPIEWLQSKLGALLPIANALLGATGFGAGASLAFSGAQAAVANLNASTAAATPAVSGATSNSTVNQSIVVNQAPGQSAEAVIDAINRETRAAYSAVK
jgi:hypothetical protein